jgi:putative ABC transport system permease protein
VGSALFQENAALIDDCVRIFDWQQGKQTFKLPNNDLFSEQGVYWVDSTIFHFWDINLLHGDPDAVLARPGTIVLSEELAEKWFRGKSPVGESVKLQGFQELNLEVTGVFRQSNPSHFRPRAMVSFSSVDQLAPWAKNNWVWNPAWTYVKLAPGVKPDQLIKEFPEFIQGHFSAAVKHIASLDLQPITEIHLRSDREFEMSENSKVIYISVFFLCAIFLFVVGSVNFINLTSAMFLVRAREMAVRKVLGANKETLARQIGFEAGLSVTLAILIALLALGLTIKPALVFLGLPFSWSWFTNPIFGFSFLGIAILITLAAAAYPALVYSRTNVQQIFKGKSARGRKGGAFRKGLVVLQFGVSLILLVFSIASYQQVDFMLNQPKGFDAENVVVVDVTSTQILSEPDQFCETLRNLDYVEEVATMNEYIGVNNNNHEFRFGEMPQGEWKYLPALMINEAFIELFEIELLAGRNYDPNMPREDSLSIIINRSMARVLGFEQPEGALGEKLQSLNGMEEVVGVVEDFHYKSMYHSIGPMVLDIADKPSGQYNYFTRHVAIRLSEISPTSLEQLEKVWADYVSNKPFEYRFLSSIHAQSYDRDNMIGTVLLVFTIITWMVAFFGLLALSLFNSRLRMKEIAIRRILGAEILDLLWVTIKTPVILVLISLLWAVPASFLIVNAWFSGFAYHVSYPLLWLICVAIILLTMAILTSAAGSTKVLRVPPANVVKEQ